LAHLGVNALAVRGYPRVAVFHALLMAVIYAKEKPLGSRPNFLSQFFSDSLSQKRVGDSDVRPASCHYQRC